MLYIKKNVRHLLWIPVIAMMFLIFSMSGKQGEESAGMSRQVSIKVIQIKTNVLEEKLEKEELEMQAEKIEYYIRKLAHFSEYALLAIFVLIALRYSAEKKGRKLYLLSEGICILYAAVDEVHQLFVPGRSGMLSDVLIDSAGATTGLALVFIVGCIFSLLFSSNSSESSSIAQS